MSAALDFDTLAQLAGSKPIADVPCPLCGPDRSTRATQRKPTLRIWHTADGFASYSCARCGEKGWAHDRVRQKASDPIERARRKAEADRESEAHTLKQRAKARWLWEYAEPIGGTVAEAYLRNRGITVGTRALRFLPARGNHPPSVLAPFGKPFEWHPGEGTVLARHVQGVHITRLRADGSGKAPDAEGRTKIMVGQSAGWPIPLVPPNDLGGLAVAEGIEDGLSLHQATGLGAWAAGAAVRLPKLAPLIARLPYIEAVTIAVDDDAAGRRHAGELARELRRLRGSSIEVATIEFWESAREAA